MNELRSLWYIVRPVNLFIVAMSQMLIYAVYMVPLLHDDALILGRHLWWLFILDTVLIAAAGYVINDFFDQFADATNKPLRVYIDEGALLSRKGTLRYYMVLVAAGFMIAAYIAVSIAKLHLLMIYPVATIALFLYSYRLKQLPLLGNVVVAIFCVFVPGIIIFAEWDVLQTLEMVDHQKYDRVMKLLLAYLTFAFLSTMVREIVKDIEDVAGDQLSGYRTMPVLLGANRSRYIALCFAVGWLLSYGLWIWGIPESDRFLVGAMQMVVMVFPTIYVCLLLYRAQSKADYSAVSKYLKVIMVLALIVFLCIPFITQIV